MFNFDIKINGESVNTTTNNRSVVKTLDKSLDFGKIVINNSTRATPYDMLDYVSFIVDDSSTIKEYDYVIESDVVTRVGKNADSKYNHVVSLIEPTKILEYYVVGNRAMTQPQTGSKWSVWDRLFQIQQTVTFEKTISVNSTRFYELGTSLNPLKNIIAEEIFANNVTAREANDRLLDTIKGVSRLVRNTNTSAPFWTLEVDKFNELNTERDRLLNIVQQNLTQDITNYTTKINTTGANQVFDGGDGGIIIEPSISSWGKLDSENSLMDLTNSAVYYQANQLKRERIKVQMRVDTIGQGIQEIDITERVQESDVRLTYKRDTQNTTDRDIGDYQSNTLIWDFNSDRITNLYEDFDGNNVIDNVIIWGLTVNLGSSAAAQNAYLVQDPSELEWRVIYKPLFTSTSQTEKQDVTTSGVEKNTTKIINQSENILSVNKSLDVSWATSQQYGISDDVTNDTDNDLSKLFEIGDYQNGYILTKMEIFYRNSYYDVKYEWTKNFQKLSELLRVNSTIELFEIPAGDRTLKRNEYYGEYVIVDTVFNNNNSLMSTGLNVFMNTFADDSGANDLNDYDKPILAMAYSSDETVLEVDPVTGAETDLLSTERLVLPVIGYAGGNSINFYWEFDSPNIAGKQLQTIDSKETLRALQYTDTRGEIISYSAKYIYDYTADKDDLPVILNANIDTVLANASDTKFTVYKNGGDKLAMTYALHVIPKAGREDDLIIGDKLIKDNNLIQWHDGVFDNIVVTGTSGRYSKYENKFAKSGGTGTGFTVSGNSLSINSALATDNWAIYEAGTNELLLAVNQRKENGDFEAISTVYFNFRNKRSDLVYDY